VSKEVCKEANKLQNICGGIGCPICSSIACSLAKATGEPITIEKIQTTEDGETIEATYQILKAELQLQAETAPSVTPRAITQRLARLPTLVSFTLIGSGSLILALITWIIWHDTTTWHKSLTEILFGSRTGEAISLGIGMKAIHYLVIGLALLTSGIIMFFHKRRKT
jgi:hypothetical protein